MTEENKEELVNTINTYIKYELRSKKMEVTLEEVKKFGAHITFICDWSHVEETNELSHLKLNKKENLSHKKILVKLIF